MAWMMGGFGRVERRQVCFRGHVQGVGFRYTTRSLARQVPVTGYVQNLASGDVRLVVEGQAADIDALIADVRRHLGGYIEQEHTVRGPATGEFDEFQVRFGG